MFTLGCRREDESRPGQRNIEGEKNFLGNSICIKKETESTTREGERAVICACWPLPSRKQTK